MKACQIHYSSGSGKIAKGRRNVRRVAGAAAKVSSGVNVTTRSAQQIMLLRKGEGPSITGGGRVFHGSGHTGVLCGRLSSLNERTKEIWWS